MTPEEERINDALLQLIEEHDLSVNDIADVIAEQVTGARNSSSENVKSVAARLERKFGAKSQSSSTTANYNAKADDFGGYFLSFLLGFRMGENMDGIAICLEALENAYEVKKSMESSKGIDADKKHKPLTNQNHAPNGIKNTMKTFNGFSLSHTAFQENIEDMNLTKETFNNVLGEFREVIPFVITGQSPVNKLEEVNLFAEFIVLFSSKGIEDAVAFTPFINFQPPVDRHLPVPFSAMTNRSKDLFLTLLEKFANYGFSDSAEIFLNKSREEVEKMTALKDCYVSFNKTAASLWLSIALNNSNSDQRLEAAIFDQARKHRMELTDSPDLNDDPELDPRIAEFNELYE